MTNPPDPITPPSLPPPDPVLQPPPPMPWDQPWQPSAPRAPSPPSAPSRRSPRKVPRDPVIITRPTAPTQPVHVEYGTPTVTPTPAPPTPSETDTTPTWRPERRRRKRPGWMIIGIVALLAICGGNLLDGIREFADDMVTGGPTLPREPETGGAVTSIAGPDTIVDGGEASFELPVGTGVRFTDQDGTWIVALTGVARVDECESLVSGTVSMVVFDIAYEVTEGGVSIFPTTDFAFELPDGTTARPELIPACAEPPLDIIPFLGAGGVHRGRIAIELPESVTPTGTFTYGQSDTPTASWTVP